MAPTLKHGKICHVELPATDLERSASFYERVFDWHARRHPGGAVTFDHAVQAGPALSQRVGVLAGHLRHFRQESR